MSTEGGDRHKRDVALEAVRGIAAIIVVLYHSCLGFWPQHTGEVAQYAHWSWQNSPLYILINGQTAVIVFFVLSGYVLTLRYFSTGDNMQLLKGAVKRWPRLVGPVILAVLFSYCLFRFGLYRFVAAGNKSGSSWLVHFAYAIGYPFIPNIRDALAQGLFLTFFRGDSFYDSSLWTMNYEFIGSFIAFGFAPILFEARKVSSRLAIALTALVCTLTFIASPNLTPFPIGVALAALLPRRAPDLTKTVAWSALFMAFYLLSHSQTETGVYAMFDLVQNPVLQYLAPATAGAVLLIYVVELYAPFKAALSGSLFRWLGEFSFPIYLVHVPIICSLGSEVFLHYGKFPAMASVIIATPITALPILLFNRYWVSMLNSVTARLLTPVNNKRSEELQMTGLG